MSTSMTNVRISSGHSLPPRADLMARVAYLVPAPGIPVRGPTGASAHVRALAKAWSDDHDVRVFAARIHDKRGQFGEAVPTIAAGTPGWPSWLDRYRDLVEVAAARRVASQVVSSARHGWMPDVVIERHTLFSDAGWRVSDAIDVPWALEVNAPPVLERRRFERLRRESFAEDWQNRVLLQAPVVLAVSRWLKTWLETEVGRAIIFMVLPKVGSPFICRVSGIEVNIVACM